MYCRLYPIISLQLGVAIAGEDRKSATVPPAKTSWPLNGVLRSTAVLRAK
jgi:hypothetical protein